MKVEMASDDDSTLSVKKAIGVAIGYQDMPLLDNVANTFGKSMSDDNEIQELLGDAFVYFGRHKDATHAFKNSLESKQDALVSVRLALAYMRSGQPAVLKAYAAYANKDIALFEKAIRETGEFNELELGAVIDNYAPYVEKDDPENLAELRWVEAATLALSAHRKGDVPA